MNARIPMPHLVTMMEKVSVKMDTNPDRDKRQIERVCERESERMKLIVCWGLNVLISWVFCFGAESRDLAS